VTTRGKMRTDKRRFTFSNPKCLHHLGYLSQRPRGEKIPEECMTCEKIVECMLSKLKGSSSATKRKSKGPIVEEVKEAAEEPAEETVEKEFEETVKPKIDTERLTPEPSGDQFVVENLGMLYASWSDTVRIDRETLSGWGRKIKEVEIETADGKRTRCKVKPREDSKKGIIQIPDKMQLSLEIMKGEHVKVKPITES